MMIHKLYHCIVTYEHFYCAAYILKKVTQRPKKQLCGVYRKVARVEVCQQVAQRPKKKVVRGVRKVV